MNGLALRLGWCLVGIGLASPLRADETMEQLVPLNDPIAQAVRDLASPRYSVREAATRKLWQMGSVAEKAVEEASRSGDAEVAQRARDILEKFRWGIYPNTPREILDAIDLFRGNDANSANAPGRRGYNPTLERQRRQQAVLRLLALGKPALPTLRKLLSHLHNFDEQQTIYPLLSLEIRRQMPIYLLREDFGTVEEMLEICLLSPVPEGIREAASDLATLYYLRGQVDAAIERYQRLRLDKQYPQAAEVLVHLYRVRGDWAKARQLAEEINRTDLLAAVLYEQGDWKELAKRGADIHPNTANSAMLQLTFERLAGNHERVEELIADLKNRAAGDGDTLNAFRTLAETLLMNRRAEQGIQLLLDKKVYSALTFDLLCAQLRYREAFDLAEAARQELNNPQEHQELEIRRARVLYLLGEKETALQLFGRLANDLRVSSDIFAQRQLLRGLIRVGAREQAVEQLGRFLDPLTKRNQLSSFADMMDPVFDKDKDLAGIWWRACREAAPDEDPVVAIRRIRDLLHGKASEADFERMIHIMERFGGGASFASPQPSTDALQHHQDAQQQLALAEAYRAAGKFVQAEEHFRNAANNDTTNDPIRSPGILYGDFLMERKRYREAAEVYRRTWERHPGQTMALFLHGRALIYAGDEKLGRNIIDRAHWLPLGSERLRGQLIEEFGKRNWPEAMRRECELVLRAGWYREWYVGNIYNAAARLAVQDKQYLQAAERYERSVVGSVRTGARFIEASAYLIVPQAINTNRARHWIASGQLEEALKEVEDCLKVMPGNIDLVISLVIELDKKKKTTQADQLYRRQREVWEKLCQQYPNSGFLHNSWAWLAANCRRDLPEAQKHAERAVALEPKNTGYLDTLAEVHFRKGEKDTAIRYMKQCLELEPRNSYYRKQLERFSKGDPHSELPDEEDG